MGQEMNEMGLQHQNDQETGVSYWNSLLAGTPEELLPEFDSMEESAAQDSLVLEFEPDGDSLRELLDKTGCPEEAFYAAAGGYLLTHYTGQKEGVIFTEAAGADGTGRQRVPFAVII